MSTIKPVSDRTAKRRLLKLADLLESDRVANHFNFAHWGKANALADEKDPLEDANACGTQACALGWAPALPFAKKLGISLYVDGFGGGFKNRHGRKVAAVYVARTLFGLTGRQIDALFYPSSSYNLVRDLDSNSGPEYVAANIRKFVAIRFG